MRCFASYVRSIPDAGGTRARSSKTSARRHRAKRADAEERTRVCAGVPAGHAWRGSAADAAPRPPAVTGLMVVQHPLRLLTIAHSYCGPLHPLPPHEMARAGGARWGVTAVATRF